MTARKGGDFALYFDEQPPRRTRRGRERERQGEISINLGATNCSGVGTRAASAYEAAKTVDLFSCGNNHEEREAGRETGKEGMRMCARGKERMRNG